MIQLQPIAFVKNERMSPEDDHWQAVVSEIILDDSISTDALAGLDQFSHLNVIFFMDQVLDEKAVAQKRHPRNNQEFPMVGTFAQRNKNRPNKLGLTCCQIISVSDRKITVKGLDALNNSPILDMKPVFEEFLPKGEVKQADWSRDIMRNYW